MWAHCVGHLSQDEEGAQMIVIVIVEDASSGFRRGQQPGSISHTKQNLCKVRNFQKATW